LDDRRRRLFALDERKYERRQAEKKVKSKTKTGV
jgi:hypothetical protein